MDGSGADSILSIADIYFGWNFIWFFMFEIYFLRNVFEKIS